MVGEIVEVSIPVDADVAAELANGPTREAMGRMITRVLRPTDDGPGRDRRGPTQAEPESVHTS